MRKESIFTANYQKICALFLYYMSKKFHILSIRNEDLSLIYSCIGIVSLLKPHSIAWKINTNIGTNLIRQKVLTFYEKDEVSMCLSEHYLYEKAQDIYRLLHNKLERKDKSRRAFISEWATFDYLLLLVLLEKDKLSLLKKLRQIRGLQHIQELNPTDIRNKVWLML